MTRVRIVEPELLDSLPADDPRAIRSRGDLRRINRLMSATSLLGDALAPLLTGARMPRVVELGAGDGTLMLALAQDRAGSWPPIRLQLLDLQPVVERCTLDRYQALGWDVDVVRADVFDWLGTNPAQSPSLDTDTVDAPVVIANLFLHHFDGQCLTDLLHGVAARARAVVFVEPRRSAGALFGSHLLGAICCNDVTRHDAVVSVRAGFRDRELSARWPHPAEWRIAEGAAGMFSHRFVAERQRTLDLDASACAVPS